MFGSTSKQKIRRRQVRERRTKDMGTIWGRLVSRVASWPVAVSVLFVISASAIALYGGATLGYSAGEQIDYPIYAKVDFQVRDAEQTAADTEAARAATPSYYTLNPSALTFDRVRADLRRLYQAAADANTFEEFEQALSEFGWLAKQEAYRRLRAFVDQPDDRGRTQFEAAVDKLPLEQEYVVADLLREPREPRSTRDFIVLETADEDGNVTGASIPHAKLVPQNNDKARRGSASEVAGKFPEYELRATVEAIVLAVWGEQPTIIYNKDRTGAKMREVAEATPEAMHTFERDKPFVSPGIIGSEDYDLLEAHHAALLEFLREDASAQRALLLQRIGLVTLVTVLSIGLLAYAGMYQPRVFEIRSRTVAFTVLILGMLAAARALNLKWPPQPELVFAPCLLAASILAITYPRRFALGAICVSAVLVTTIVQRDLAFLLTLLSGVAVVVYLLDEIRSRTKLITSGMATAAAIMIASVAGGLLEGHTGDFIMDRALWGGGCALFAAFVVSGILPFIERLFRIATALTLLEWRDPTKPLLQRLAREAPGTYNHSLVLGTLASTACERIGANGLLAQVGALYHDIGKIHKAHYFAENQEGNISRHDNLAPTMSLLIILGHVKDGVEMAKEYGLPRVLQQFIEAHHGTTVVRYFHHIASEKQPQIASGKHDREVREAEFRYSGPKPKTREAAVVMICDGVESAVRALPEPTVGRIESVVRQIVTDRLNDGQFDDCDITLMQIRLVEDSLVKSLCSIHHGRIAYPKARKATEEPSKEARLSG